MKSRYCHFKFEFRIENIAFLHLNFVLINVLFVGTFISLHDIVSMLLMFAIMPADGTIIILQYSHVCVHVVAPYSLIACACINYVDTSCTVW